MSVLLAYVLLLLVWVAADVGVIATVCVGVVDVVAGGIDVGCCGVGVYVIVVAIMIVYVVVIGVADAVRCVVITCVVL